MAAPDVPRLGAIFRLRIRDGRARAPAVMLLGTRRGDLPIGGGCRALISPVVTATPGTTDARGAKGGPVFFTGAVIDLRGRWLEIAAVSDGLQAGLGR